MHQEVVLNDLLRLQQLDVHDLLERDLYNLLLLPRPERLEICLVILHVGFVLVGGRLLDLEAVLLALLFELLLGEF